MKNSILTVILLTFISLDGFSQDFKKALESKNSNFKEIKITLKEDSNLLNSLSEKDQKRFGRWDWYWRSHVDSSGSFQRIQDEMIKYSDMSVKSGLLSSKKSASSYSWTSLGPNTRPGNQTSTTGRGLVSTIWVDPTDFDHILIGASNGGLWETENGGTNWSCLTEGVLLGGVTDIAVHPTNSDIIYLGTQVRAANGSQLGLVSQYSLGLFKSTDGGANWTSILGNLVNVFDDARIAIAVDANNPNYIYALYSDRPDGYYADVGFEQSTNAGSSWTVKQSPGSNLDAAGFLTQVWVSTDSDIFAGGIRIKRSSNEGSTFGNYLTSGEIRINSVLH